MPRRVPEVGRTGAAGRASWAELAGALPRAYILVAFANFTVGVCLGLSMAISPALWPMLSAVHAELNPFGWLTILIYGMTYAVLTLFANLRPPWPTIGWVQLASAELGVVLVALAPLVGAHELTRIGMLFQAAAPVIFTVNIVTAVFARRSGKGRGAVAATVSETDWPDELDRRFFGRARELRATDRIAQRGTTMALLIYLVAVVWALIHVQDPSVTAYSIHGKDRLLVYYGWILGTVLSVSLHLVPRYAAGQRMVTMAQAQAGQLLWLAGMVLIAVSPWPSGVASLGARVLGAAIVFHALLYGARLGAAVRGLARAVAVAWYGGWGFALLLGGALIAGLDPLSLAALHLLFLGWITSLVYGVGYTFFPFVLRKRVPSPRLAVAQVGVSLLGAAAMTGAFLWLGTGNSSGTVTDLLAVGGLLAALGALYFLAQWLLSRQTPPSIPADG